MTVPPISLLFVPGHRAWMVEKAPSIDVDAIVLDLEDSVPPAEKAAARRQVRQALEAWDVSRPAPYVRINPPRNGMVREDAEVVRDYPDVCIVIPKVDRSLELEIAGEPMALHKRTVIVTVETPQSFFHLEELADHVLVDGLCLGGEDLAFSMGLRRTLEAHEFDVPRFLIVAAARAAEIRAYDSICPEFQDLDILRADARRGSDAGMDGKFAIHPAQIPVIHDEFLPSEAEHDYAQRAVDAYDEAVARGEGAVAIDGQMIDPPVAERLRAITNRRRQTMNKA